MKKSKEYILNLLLVISIFPMCEYMREFIVKPVLKNKEWIANFNPILFFIILYLAIKTIRKKKINHIWFLLLFITLSMLVFISMANQKSQNNILVNMIAYSNVILPMTLLLINCTERLDFQKLFKTVLIIINVTIIIVVALGCIDFITGGKVQFFLKDYYFTSEYFKIDIERNFRWFYRYYSILGHPLRLSGAILIGYSLNLVYDKYYGKIININFLNIVSIIGVALSNSKTGIVCIISLILYSSFREKKGFIIKLSLITIAILIILNTDFFRETVINRFVNTSLTTGRSEVLNFLFDTNIKKPGLIGNGYRYSYIISGLSNTGVESFEYPFIMFSFDYGIIATFIIYGFFFIFPSYILMKNRDYFIYFIYLIVFMQFNTHAGITLYTDTMGQMIFFIYILLNTSYDKKRKESLDNEYKEKSNI